MRGGGSVGGRALLSGKVRVDKLGVSGSYGFFVYHVPAACGSLLHHTQEDARNNRACAGHN